MRVIGGNRQERLADLFDDAISEITELRESLNSDEYAASVDSSLRKAGHLIEPQKTDA